METLLVSQEQRVLFKIAGAGTSPLGFGKHHDVPELDSEKQLLFSRRRFFSYLYGSLLMSITQIIATVPRRED
jgi:hypothetical protein